MKSQVMESLDLKITGHLNLFKLTYENKNGDIKPWLLASRKSVPKVMSRDFSPDAVVIMAMVKETLEYVILREYRPSVDGVMIEFPAGKIDPGESIEDAVRRELKEETGFDLVGITHQSPPLYSSSGMTDESIVFVKCMCEGELSIDGLEESEEIQPFTCSPLYLQELLHEENVFYDVRLWMALNTIDIPRNITGVRNR
jgi:ADP-ribose pyrophosphatase